MQRDPCVEAISATINASAEPLRSMRLAPLRGLADTGAPAQGLERALCGLVRAFRGLERPYGVDGQLLNVSLRIGVAELTAANVSGAALVLAAEPVD